jgi:hypothetical protein
MAYYNGFQTAYQPMYQPYNQSFIPNQTQTPSQQVQQSSIIWVSGETGAKSYLVAPNSTVLLMDSENQRFYLKSSDASGMPMPLRVFEYTEKTQNAPNKAQEAQTIDYSSFATKAELDALRSEIDSISKSIPRQTMKTRKMEVDADG